jgi:hypothetical protein
LKAPPGSAGAQIIPAEFLDQFLVAMNDAMTALDARFGREPFPTLAAALERKGRRRDCDISA